MQILLRAICEAGLNRGRIRDTLTALDKYNGVTGEMIFDPNCKDIRPLYLASVHNGEIEYRQTSMEKAYARIGEDGVQYAGPRLPDRATSDVKLAVFGTKTDDLIHSPAAAALLDQLNRNATHHISLIGIPSDVQWGKASSALVQALYDQHAIGIIATSRDSSHLAEQLGVKNFVPVIAISSDHSLTSTNVPWIFPFARREFSGSGYPLFCRCNPQSRPQP